MTDSGKCSVLLSSLLLNSLKLNLKFLSSLLLNSLKLIVCLSVSDWYLLSPGKTQLKQHPDWYLLGVQLKFPDEHPRPFYIW